MEDEGIKCIVARSALILGFSYKRDGVQDKMHILRELQQKRTIVYNKEVTHIPPLPLIHTIVSCTDPLNRPMQWMM
jgi:hypothetical protein